MILLEGQSLKKEIRLQPESLGITLEEKRSSATMQLGPEDPEVAAGRWLLDDESGTGKGVVWRVRAVDTNYNTDTRTLTLEHIINTLQDTILFGEHTWEDIAGGGTAACTAEQAARYILRHQSLWTLGGCECDEAWPFKFNGDTLYSALVTVTNACEDACWEFDLSRIPFKLYIRRISDDTACEMRAGRNISTLKKQIDRSGMYTRFYPIGKDDLHISGNYISKNESKYGVICKVETFSGAESESALRSWAWKRLNKHCFPKVTVTISGLDLSESTGEPLDKLTLGRKCRVPLPEYGDVITERIIKIRCADKIRKKEEVTLTLGNELPDLASIVGEVEKEQASGSGGGGRGGMKQAGEDHAWFVDTEDHVAMVAEAVAGEGAAQDWSRVAEVLVDGQGVHQRVTYAEGELVTHEARIDVTERAIQQEVTDRSRQGETLNSRITQTAEAIQTEVTNRTEQGEQLSSRITQNANSIQTEVSDRTNQARLLESRITQTETDIQTEVTNRTTMGEQLGSRITQNATSITTEVEARTALGVSLGSQIQQNADAISLRVQKGDVGTQLAVEMGNVSISGGNLVVDGYVTSAGLSSAIGDIENLMVQNLGAASIEVEGDLGANAASFASLGVNGYDVSNPIVSGTVTNNELTLLRADGTTAVTFSKATTLEGVWDGGTLMVNAYQTNNGVKTKVRGFTSSHSLGLAGAGASNFSVEMRTRDTGDSGSGTTLRDDIRVYLHENVSGTGSTVVAGANADGSGAVASISTRATYNSGYNNGSPLSGTAGARKSGVSALVHTFAITRVDGTTKDVEIDCSSIYSAARSGYTYGTFTQATVTLQGAAESVYVSNAKGAAYYAADSAVTYYKGDGTDVVGRGDTETCYVESSKGTYYLRGTSATRYKKGTQATYYLRDSSSVKKLKYYGNTTLYVAPAVGATGYSHEWYYVDGNGTNYYQAGGSVTVTPIGDSQTVYLGDGKQLASATRYKGNGSTVTPRGAAVTVTPIKASSKLTLLLATRYAAGTEDKTTYYTKS